MNRSGETLKGLCCPPVVGPHAPLCSEALKLLMFSFWTSDSAACLQTRPTPPHLTSAMAENILAAACENESRNAAKRMRLEAYHVGPHPVCCRHFEH